MAKLKITNRLVSKPLKNFNLACGSKGIFIFLCILKFFGTKNFKIQIKNLSTLPIGHHKINQL